MNEKRSVISSANRKMLLECAGTPLETRLQNTCPAVIELHFGKRLADRNGAANRRILSTFVYECATNYTKLINSGLDRGKGRRKGNLAF
jgi:hypothetical protein